MWHLPSHSYAIHGYNDDSTHLIIFCKGVLLAPGDLVISAHTSSATGARQSSSKVYIEKEVTG